MEYKIIKAYAFVDFEKLIQKHLDDGWTFAGNTFTHKEMLLREMVREKRSETSNIIPDVADQEFKLRYEKLLDQKFKDLLDVNNIHLISQNGKLYTLHNDEMAEGINPVHILQLLRASKHYPINTDEDWVVKQVENIL